MNVLWYSVARCLISAEWKSVPTVSKKNIYYLRFQLKLGMPWKLFEKEKQFFHILNTVDNCMPFPLQIPYRKVEKHSQKRKKSKKKGNIKVVDQRTAFGNYYKIYRAKQP